MAQTTWPIGCQIAPSWKHYALMRKQTLADPFLIAYGLRSRNDRTVVTNEITKPGKQRANKKVPDGCNQMRVTWMDSFGLIRALDFSTSWRTAAGV